jgi:hypothetical protein
MESMTESKFNMWRACIAAIYLDKFVTIEERIWAEDKINKLPLSIDQKLILTKDLGIGSNFEASFKKITDKKDLAFLLNTLRVISYVDKDFSAIERESFKNLEAIVLKGIDLKAITAEIEIMELESYNESEVYKNNNPYSTFEKIHHSFMKFINPGEYKFPKN